MLRRAELWIEENILREKILCAGCILVSDLQKHGVETIVREYSGVRGEETDAWMHDVLNEQTDLGRENVCIGTVSCGDLYTAHSSMAQGTLYITDSEAAYRVLRQHGRYVLAYRHEENQGASFAGGLYVIEKIEEVDYEIVDMAYRRLAGLPWEILTTKRCIIRETIEADTDSFYSIYAGPDITKYMEDLYADKDEEIAYIRDYREKVYAFYGYGMWSVLTKEGTVIGRAGINWREGFDLPELGFVIGVPWQRQGYAYEVCSAILAYADAELGFSQVQALVMEGNDKSAALCRKLGLQWEEKVILEDGVYDLYRNL